MDELDLVNQQIEEMRLALFEKKELNWHDKQQLGEMLKSQEELRQKLDELIQMNENQFNGKKVLKQKQIPTRKN